MKNIDSITREEIRHLAALTRIKMTEEEIEVMRGQMSDILDSIEVLNLVDTDGVEPTGHSVNVNSVMREDVSSDSISLEDALANAPQREQNFLRIRSVLD